MNATDNTTGSNSNARSIVHSRILQMKAPKLYGLITQECLDAFIAGNFTSTCVKDVIGNCLSVGILLGALAVKLPQILKIVKAKSVEGISETSFVVELCGAVLACVYNILQGHHFMTWGEMAIVGVQCGVQCLLFWKFAKPAVSMMPRISCAAAFAALVCGVLSSGVPDTILPVLGAVPNMLAVISRVPQIRLNFSQGHTGQVAFLTFFLSFLGNLGRVFTSITQVGDPVLIAGTIASAVCNGTVAGQVLVLGAPKKKQKKA